MNYQKRIYNRVVSGLTGLVLLVTSSGCVDSINGVSLRRDSINYKIHSSSSGGPVSVTPGSSVIPSAGIPADEKKDDDNTYLIGGIIIGVAAAGGIAYGIYELVDDNGKHRGGDAGPSYGGGENGGGPGGQ